MSAARPRKLRDYSERRVLDLVGLIYDAAVQPAAWRVFLEEFAGAVRGGATSLLWYDFRRLHATISYTVRVDPDHVRKYHEYYDRLDVWGRAAKRISKPGLVFVGEDLCPNEQLEHSEFYSDFLRPMKSYHVFGGIVAQEESTVGVITSHSPKASGPSEKELSLLRFLMPHLQRAFQMHSRVVDLESRLDAATHALDRLPVGFILVDGEGKVLLANRAGRRMVNQRDGLSVSREGLTAARPSEHAALRQLIRRVAATSNGNGVHSGGMLLISRPSLKRPFSVIVAPRPSNGCELGPARAAAIVFVSDPEIEVEPDHAALSRLFGLTPAESKFAALLAQGKSLEESASEFSITRETARTHLKRIFDKTSTHRQGELVRLLLTAVPQGHLR